MNENNQLQIVLKAIDEASNTLQKVSAEVEKLTGSLNDATKASDKNNEAQKTVAQSSESMALSVFKGAVSYEALKKSLETVSEFMKSSIEDAIKAQAIMAQVQQNVENAGGAYAEIGPKINAYAESVQRLGFDGEDTAESVSRLMLVTKNYDQAIQLNNLAMDLARSKHIDLASATMLVTQVTQGNGKVLKQYGVDLSDTASAADNLAILQDKVKGSSEAFAGTMEGQLTVMKDKWGDIKKEVGNQLIPIIQQFFTLMQIGMPFITDLSNMLGESLKVTGTILNNLLGKLPELFSAIAQTSQALDAQYSAEEKLQKQTNEIVIGYNKLHKEQAITVEQYNAMSGEQQRSIILEAKHAGTLTSLGGAVKTTTNAFVGIGVASKSSQDALTKLGDSLTSLGSEYQKVKDSVDSALAEMKDSHKANMSSINDSISKTKDSIQKLNEEYSRSSGDATKSVAEAVVASENKIADIKKQITNETSQENLATLQQQLATEEANLNSAADFVTNNAGAITEARRRASETELQRTIEDYQNKQALATADFNSQMKQLQDELKAQKKKRDEEVQLYNERSELIKGILLKANTDYQAISDERVKITQAEVEKEIALFQKLQSVISNAKSASGNSLNLNKATVAGARANGGPVTGGNTYLVGENGPELFTPVNSGNIIPNGAGGGSVKIDVTINGGLIDEDIANQIGNLMVGGFRRVTRI